MVLEELWGRAWKLLFNLDWGRAWKSTIQPLVNLQNKAAKCLKTSNKASMDEMYMQSDILKINNLFKMSAGKCRQFDSNNQLQPHFNQYFKSPQTVHKYPTTTLNNFFLPMVNSSHGQCSLKFIGPKVWLEIPDHIKFRSHFDFKHLCKNYLVSGLVGAK